MKKDVYMQIRELEVKEEIIKGLEAMAFTELTAIQENAITPILEGKDVIGQAHTGTGKTAAFAIPVLNNLDIENNRPQCLILCPTRELAVQVKREIKSISRYMEISSVSVYGGAPIVDQIKKIKRGCHIIVGTPGRTIDLIKRKVIKFDHIKTIILDEADEMLKMGFKEDIDIILQNASDEIQTLLFSATIPKNVLLLKGKYQKDPVFIKTVSNEVTSDTIKQNYYLVKHANKVDALARIIDIYSPKLTLVFCNTKRKVDEVTEQMINKGYNCDKIHGDIKQSIRLDVLNKFNNGVINILIATDVAARGLDIKHVEAVVNFDVPDKEDYYVHRIGRTGRAGSQGYSFTLTSSKELDRIANIEKYTKKIINKRNIPTAEKVVEIRKEKIVNEILENIVHSDLKDMRDMANQLYNSEYDSVDVIAALLKMNYSFAMKDNNIDLNEKVMKRVKKSTRQSTDTGSFDRFYIGVGKKDKAKPSDILGAITGECGIPGDHVAKIDIYETFSFFDVLSMHRKKILANMKNVTIKNRTTSAELTRKRKK